MIIHERLAYLIRQVENQSATADELKELSDLVLEDSTGALSAQIEQMLQVPAMPAADPAHWDQLADRILQADRPKVVRMWTWGRIAAAAAVLALIGVSSYFFLQRSSSPKVPVVAQQSIHTDMPPGGNKAMLTLADGREISLDSAANGPLAQQAGTQVIKSAGGQLLYRAEKESTNTALLFNKISTPRGGQYQLTLPDSTRVWLNAASTLRYPAAFAGRTRTVQLTGEAYFEVAKNAAMPFTVNVDDLEVQVLGTHFNVMAYNDEAQIKTTLLEGAVKVNKNGNSRRLVPGQGAHFNRSTGALEVTAVDTEEAIAWKNGFIQLEGNDLPAVMRQISRWYNVDIVYKGTVPAHFKGIIPRNVPVSQVLKMMELTGEVHFQINEHQIIVSP
ncbi:FecR family protein [Chitinophaga sp.]|uniref:FecR family protein n=1 Tax=Chitinophaga sp. TaxID=1869181 RepID=UPI002F9512D5